MSLNQTLVDAVQSDNVVSLHNNREAIKASAQDRDQNGDGSLVSHRSDTIAPIFKAISCWISAEQTP